MVVLGYMLLTVGLVACLYWQVRFLVLAYNQSLWWFFGCLFVPLVDWIFLFVNFKMARKPFGLSLLGLLVAGLGGHMAGSCGPSDMSNNHGATGKVGITPLFYVERGWLALHERYR